jgi:hypothetical protein
LAAVREETFVNDSAENFHFSISSVKISSVEQAKT